MICFNDPAGEDRVGYSVFIIYFFSRRFCFINNIIIQYKGCGGLREGVSSAV